MESKYDWIEELVKAEEHSEETGTIEFADSLNPERTMIGAALTLLNQLRTQFQEVVDVFNTLKRDPSAKIKIYGVAKTHADFMLFRFGYKLIFSLKQPGVISIKTQYVNPTLPSVSSMNLVGASVSNSLNSIQYRGNDEQLEMNWGPFNECLWTYKGQTVKPESVVKYFFTKFIYDTSSSNM